MQLNFTKVLLLSFTRKATMGTAKFSAALSKPVVNAMRWGDVPDWQKSSTPAGKLIASQIELEPKDPARSKHSVILEAKLVEGFEIVRTEAKGKAAKKSKAFKTELTFNVHFSDATGARKLEEYMQPVFNAGDSSMIVTYEKEPEQEELPGTSEADTKQGELETIVEDTKRRRAAKDVN